MTTAETTLTPQHAYGKFFFKKTPKFLADVIHSI